MPGAALSDDRASVRAVFTDPGAYLKNNFVPYSRKNPGCGTVFYFLTSCNAPQNML